MSTEGAHFVARSIGAQNLGTVNREVFGVPDGNSGFSGNGMCEFNFGLPPVPLTNTPPPASAPDPHDYVRTMWQAQDMADRFYQTGTVVQTCANGGPCSAPADWSDGGQDLPPDAGAPEEAGASDAGPDAPATMEAATMDAPGEPGGDGGGDAAME